jgi:hypothetical protein
MIEDFAVEDDGYIPVWTNQRLVAVLKIENSQARGTERHMV